jgi:hypothetical protein
MRNEARRGRGGSGAMCFRGYRRAPRTTAVIGGIRGHDRSRGGGKWEPVGGGGDSEPMIDVGDRNRPDGSRGGEGNHTALRTGR